MVTNKKKGHDFRKLSSTCCVYNTKEPKATKNIAYRLHRFFQYDLISFIKCLKSLIFAVNKCHRFLEQIIRKGVCILMSMSPFCRRNNIGNRLKNRWHKSVFSSKYCSIFFLKGASTLLWTPGYAYGYYE